MKKFNKWMLLAGLILFFAGLDVALLLSHMSRLVGVFFLMVGASLIIASNSEWTGKVKSLLPDGFVNQFTPDRIPRINKVFFLLLILLSVPVFHSQPLTLVFVVITLVTGEVLLWKYGGISDPVKVILVSEFQVFIFLSTAVYIHFGTLFGYREIPQIFPLFFLIGAWIVELGYIKSKLFPSSEEKRIIVDMSENEERLSEQLIHLVTFNGKLKGYMPLAGSMVILLVITFNLLVHGSLSLGSHDGITLLLGVSLIFYNRIPNKYSTERDFALLFLAFLFLILVLPITVIHYTQGPLTEDTNSPVVYHLLARPTSALLNLIGISSRTWVTAEKVLLEISVPSAASSTGYLPARVSIGLSCTGLYSVTTFVSAFLAFLMVHFSKFNYKLGAFMVLGIFASWVANVFRMTLIMVVRYHYGREAMLWTHHNAGIFIFMAWIALFWGLMFKYFEIPVSGNS